jgi:hypothetical protein
MDLSADSAYRTSLVIGFILALKRRCFAVKYVISSLSAISDIVRYSPFNFISLKSIKKFYFFQLLNFKKCIFLILFLLTLLYLYDTI